VRPGPLRAATRGSPLALWQTEFIARQLAVDVELVIVETDGDTTQATNTPIETLGGQGIFVKAVEAAVLDGRADFAVHSAKDLPSVTEEGLSLACIPARGDPRDALIGCTLEALPPRAVVATGSVRRRAQLAARRPDVVFENLRGNIATRLKKSGGYDAIVMAYVALLRLEIHNVDVHVLDPSVMLPQVAQGAIAVECRAADDDIRTLLGGIEHRPSRLAVNAERAFLARLGGACDLPAGAYATVQPDGQIEMHTLLASLDGSSVLRRTDTGNDGRSLGTRMAETLLYEDGGERLLATTNSIT